MSKETKTIEVTGCKTCPFTDDGIICNIDKLYVAKYGSNGTPTNCPLKKQSITIKIKE